MQLTKHWAAQLDDYAIDLAWSPDGTQLAAASSAGPVSLFASADGKKLHELPGHENGTNCLAWQPSASTSGTQFSPINSQLHLATGGQDGAVKFWDATAGQHTATSPLGPTWVEHLAWVPASTSRAESGSPLPALKSQLLFASAGRKLVALRADGSVAHTLSLIHI